MSVLTDFRAALERAACDDICRDQSSDRVWRLTYPGMLSGNAGERRAHVDAVKRELFTILARTGSAVIRHPDSPEEELLPGEWRAANGPDAWHLPADLNLLDPTVIYWLFVLGNWTAIFPSADLGASLDLARVSATALLEWMDNTGADVVIDSFHDDVSWTVVLGAAG